MSSNSSSSSTAEPGAATPCCNAPTLLAAAATSFFFCLLFVLFFLCLRFVLLRRHWRRNARVLHQEHHHQQQQQQAPKLGLDAAAIASLPSFPYRPSAGAEAEAECAVCLYGLDEDQMVREIPGCKHVFHQECIDVWLASRASCPVCRAKAEPVGRAEERIVAVEVSDDDEIMSSSSSTLGETQTERALWTRPEAGSGLV
ncbi:hypothetical protein PR202_gb27109 [Eleusine coracana subsp. coracana]|uniref:RING-type E3 ubiquitin transferase n=1 Tax=Eleusine coracana subsp. coracana TaxID=191504 RepID=A0AAV5FTV9_ELECO|nr:hypothetical protein PR202_gb27109 [Eleusine coracana subsp. coracana]